MAIRTVTVKIRIKTPEGKRVYANPVWETKVTSEASLCPCSW